MAKVLNYLRDVKTRIIEDSCESLLFIVTFIPTLAGFSILKEKVYPYFWFIHIPLMIYIYGLGCLVYLVLDAVGPEDYVQNFVNVSLLLFVGNISYWWLKNRRLLMSVVKLVREVDQLSLTSKTDEVRVKHGKAMRVIKIIIFIFYITNHLNATIVYIPHRIDVTSHYSMRPCVGIEPLTSSPKGEICQMILFLQECSIMTVTLNFQALLVLFIAHTATMYDMLASEMQGLANSAVYSAAHNDFVKQKLPTLIYRHVLLLNITDNLRTLYSIPIGINFISNAICMCLFFYLPLQAWLSYMPILVYCFLVFFLYCFLGQRLVDASERFQRGVYDCGWESFDVKEMKAVYVMLRQAQRPVELLAADIVPVNIYTFATTLQAMFKFVTVVKI